MELIPNQWKFPSTVEELIVSFSRPEELKEKLFYLSLFVNKDVVVEIAILYHKLTYQFKNIEEFIVNFINNKFQVSNICTNYWFENIPNYLKQINSTKINHISFYVKKFDDKDILIIPTSYSKFLFGIFINNNIDIDKIKSITVNNYNPIEFDLTKPFIVNQYGRLFRPKKTPSFIISNYAATNIYFDTTYSNKEIFDNILSCTVLSPTLDYELNYNNYKNVSLL